MMVSFSNGSLSGEASNKRPLENGCMPKYKPRKVSAVREFPPGCGPNAVQNLKPEENGSCEPRTVSTVGVLNLEITNAVVANGVGTSRVTGPVEAELVGNSEIPKFAKPNGVSGAENFVGSNGVESSNIEMELQPHEAGNNYSDNDEIKSLDALVEEIMENVNVSKSLVREIGSLGIQVPEEVGSLGHEAVNNPVEMERDQLDTYVGKVTTTITNGFSKEVDGLLRETNLVEKELSLGNLQISSSSCVEPQSYSRQKDKYCPRRVSSIRDFPPLCGTLAPSTVKEEREMAVSGNGHLNRTEKVKLVPSATIPKNVSEKGTTEEGLMTSQKGVLIGLQNVPVENDTTEPLSNGGRRELPEESVEGDPMDFGNCNRDLQQRIIEKTGASPGSGIISKAVVDNCIKGTGGSSGKGIAGYSPNVNDKGAPQDCDVSLGNEPNKEIVHGLMATPYCPWRKSKVAVKNSDGGMSGKKIKQKNLSRMQNPKAVGLNSDLNENSLGGPSLEETAIPDSCDADETPFSLTDIDVGDCGTSAEGALLVTPISMFIDVDEISDNEYSGPIQNDDIVNILDDVDDTRPLHDVFISEDDVDREVVHGLMASPNCPWRKGKTSLSNLDIEMSGEKKRKQNLVSQKKGKAVAKKSTGKILSSGSLFKKKNKVHISNNVDESIHKIKSSGPSSTKKKKVHMSNDVDDDSPGAMMFADDGDDGLRGDSHTNFPANHKQLIEVKPPPLSNSSGHGDARKGVKETLRYFYYVYRKFLQQEESNTKPEEEGNSSQSGRKANRIDLMTVKHLKDKGKLVNPEKMIGAVPGVEVGDEFQYRVELAVVGIHFPYQSGIDSAKFNGVQLATSIVSSGGYSDNADEADILIYSGQGGNVVGIHKAKEAEDQKLERGNLALKNSMEAKTPVRVVRGWKELKIVDPLDSKPKMVATYIYDGLYTVTNYWMEPGPRGKQVFQFEMKRNPGQPELAWKELKKSNKFKTRPGTCVNDISRGKELIPIAAVNNINDDKPPQFEYTSKMMYPDWYFPEPPKGCDCTGRCSDSKRCSCAVKNGGLPYNRNGALVETKPFVYECGPHCKCPPSCYNRTSQRGIKFKLEIFKTEKRGWGVRPLTSIPSGSFICEYAGELLEDKEAEQRIGSDEYLFDIGQSFADSSEPEGQEIAAEINEEGGYTIDACRFGNVGRFINHSCEPNLHAQNVIIDHVNKRMPHIMLFAMENISPLQELTYHYNYCVDQVRDSNGNIKSKSCFCGATHCSGRMY